MDMAIAMRFPAFVNATRDPTVTGVANSAAAVGVAAVDLQKSARVVSVSCPTLEIIGTRDSKWLVPLLLH